MEKDLDFAPIQKKLNESELRGDFNEFCKRMRLKWYFRNESQNLSKAPVFLLKSRWQPPQGHLCCEVFLSQVENELLELPNADIKYSNLSREDWNVIRSLADDRIIIIKKADKGSRIVIWGRNDYLMETEKQLSNKKVYQEVIVILSKLAKMSNKMFSSLKERGYITEKQLKYFPCEYRKAINFGKLYFLPNIHKRLHNVPRQPVSTPTEKC